MPGRPMKSDSSILKENYEHLVKKRRFII